ncbi:hypothetical protein [Virgibacillus ainsalahensis]
MNGTESQTMENYYETLFNQLVAGLKTHINIPFGRPKGDESITEESISKLCGIKATEHRFDSDVISIMWLDYQDEIWDAVFNESNVYPLNSFRGSVRSTQLRTTLLQTW